MKSNFMSINWMDVLKAFGISAAGSFISALAIFLKNGKLPTLQELLTVALIALSVGLSYIATNFFTNSSGQFMATENKTNLLKFWKN